MLFRSSAAFYIDVCGSGVQNQQSIQGSNHYGKLDFSLDIVTQEIDYLRKNPNSRYNMIIKNVHDFPHYIDYFPQGAIVRKIGIMAKEVMSMKSLETYVFFTPNEFNDFLENTSSLIYKLMQEKHYTD